MSGQDLYYLLFNSIDLPDHVKSLYLENFFKKYSINSEEMTLESLREIVADFLQETILELDKSRNDFELRN